MSYATEETWKRWGKEGSRTALVGGELRYQYQGITFLIRYDGHEWFFCDEESIDDGPDMKITAHLDRKLSINDWFLIIREYADDYIIENAERD